MGPTVINYVEEYFHTLNPLAKRIVEEINHTREAYESLWDGLSVPEQRQILDEAIIRPEAVLKYSRNSTLKESEAEVFPCLRLQTGAKYVVYEDGPSGKGIKTIKWRDEHSAPFSWLTRSQQDLRNFSHEDPSSQQKQMSKSSTPVRRARPKPPAPPAPSQQLEMDPPSLVLGGSSAKLMSCTSPSKQTILNKLISKTAVFKLPFAGKAIGPSEARDSAEMETLITKEGPTPSPKIVKPAVLKPKTPPPPPPPSKPAKKTPPVPPSKPAKKISPPVVPAKIEVIPSKIEQSSSAKIEMADESQEEREEGSPLLPPETSIEIAANTAAIPKTGFEFLDNW